MHSLISIDTDRSWVGYKSSTSKHKSILTLLLENSVFHIEKSNKKQINNNHTNTEICTLIKRSVTPLGGLDLLVEILNFLFYKTLRGLESQLKVKVFVVLSVNFSEIQHSTR